jgi:hypothetical protein
MIGQQKTFGARANGGTPCRRPRRRRAFSICYLAVAMVGVFAFASLALDYGKMQAGKTELRRAADAGARAAATQLGTITNVQNFAYQWAYANACDGTAVAIDKTTDVEFWDYNSTDRTHKVLTGTARTGANAVKVTCRRTLPLVAARVLGAQTCTVQASAVAALVPPGFGLIGINSITLKGNSTASYWSSTGVTGGNSGSVASNGPITSTNNSVLAGSIWHLAGQTVSPNISATAIRTLTQPLSYPNGSSAPYSLTNNDNAKLPTGSYSGGSIGVGNNKSYSIPGGNYVVNNFTINAGGNLNLLGPTTIYAYGSVTLNGPATANGNLPKNLTIIVMPNPYTGAAPGPVSISSSSALYSTIYAPQSDVTLSGTGAIYGSIVGKTVNITGSADIYYDLSMTGGSGCVQVVQ